MKKILSVTLVALASLFVNNVANAQTPTIPASAPYTVGKSTTSISINWSSGNGTYRIVTCALASSGTSYPTNGTSYTPSSTFGSGASVGSSNFVIYNGTSYGCNAFGLTPNTYYRFRVFEYNTLLGNEYYLTSNTPFTEITLETEPATAASALTFSSVTTNSASLSFTSGSGTYDLLALRASTSYTNVPVDGTDYTPSAAYGSGSYIAGTIPYSYVLSDGVSTTVNTTSLAAGTTYTGAVFPYNGYSGANNYKTTGYPTTTFTTLATEPTTYSYPIAFSNITDNSMTVSWTPPTSGGGVYRIVTCKVGTVNSALPVDATYYAASSFFGSGTQLGSSGAYCVYNGYGTFVNVTGLSASTDYTFSVFEYNVANNTYNNTYNYYTAGYLTGTQPTPAAEPTVAPSALTFSSITNNSFRASWANGNGARRIVGVAAGRKQTGLAFDGVNDYVSIANESNFDFTTSMTVEAWVKTSGFTVNYQTIVAKGDNSWRLARYGGTNFLSFDCTIGGSSYAAVGSRVITDGKWHHIAGVYTGSQLQLYIDGSLDGYSNVSGSIDNSSYPVYIGENAQTTGRYFSGQIDEVRIWNNVQYYWMLQGNMNKTLVGNELGLKGYWKLDDGYTTTSTALNSSFTPSVNGTLVGFASTAAATSFTGTSGWIHSGAKVNVPLDFNSYVDNSSFMSTTSTSYYYGNLYYTVYRGPDSTTINVTSLSPSTYYTVGVFDYNGVVGNNNYLTDTYAIGEVQTLAASAPTITSVSPISGFVGSLTTITGTGFNTTAANNIVYFGATKATVISVTGTTSMVVKVPQAASFSPVTVTNNTLTAYSPKPFVVTSPCGSAAFSATSLNTVSSASAYYPSEIRVADIDQDGLPDIVGVSTYGYSAVTRNTSTSTTLNLSSLSYIYNGYSNAADLDLADLDGDGKIDIATANSYSGNGTVMTTRNTSTPANVTAGTNSEFAGIAGYAASDIAIADLDKDGKPDVILSYNNNYISVFRNISSIGNINFATRADYAVAGAAVINTIAVGDLDSDGKVDIALAGGTGTQIYYFKNNSTAGSISLATYASIPLTGTITGIAIGDIDTDTKPEIVYGYGTGNVGVLKNNSSVGTISISNTPTVLTTLGNTPNDVKLGDLDGDNKVDITVGYASGSYVSIFKNSSTTSPVIGAKFDFAITASTTTPLSVGVYDMNGDSKADVLATNNGGNVSFFQNNINALAAEPTVQASNLVFSAVTTSSITVTFTPGNGANKVVFVRAASSPGFTPMDGVSYVPNTTFGSGTDLGSGNYCVFDGNGSGVTVSGLMPNTSYIFSVYEYNGLLNCQYNYLPSGTTNSGTQATNNNPPTLTAISNPASICQSSGLQTINLTGIGTGSVNETQTLTITASSSNTGLIPTPTVSYTSPAATGSLSYTPVAGVSGTAVITVTVNDGATNNNIFTRTFTVTVDHTPTTSVAGPNQNICPGVATLAGNTPAYGTGAWTIIATTNAGITVTAPTNPTSSVTGFIVGDSATFRWTISNGACASSGNNVRVKRVSCPTTADFTANTTSQCLNGTPVVTFTDASISSGSTVNSWSWNFGAGATPATANTQGPHTVLYSTAGPKHISLTVTDLLGANDNEIKFSFVNINDVPNPSGNVSGTTTVCQGQSGVTYSVPAISGATGYTWSLPSGATLISGVNTNNITVNYGTSAISGNISVAGTNTCGSGTVSANFPVTINPLPANAGSITGLTAICDGATGITYSVPSIANATSYAWTVPAGVTITSATNTNSITFNLTPGLVGGTISVQGVNSCGNGVSSSINFIVNPYPSAADVIVGQASITTCPSTSGVTYSIPLANNATSYNWTVPSGATIVSGAGTNSITVDYSAGAVSGNVTVTPVNSCGNGTSSTLPVVVNTLPDVAGQIGGNDTVSLCPVSNAVNYYINPVFNAAYYMWTIPAGATIVSGDSTNAITVNYSNTAVSGTISVYAQNACGVGTTSSISVFVSPVPTQELCMVSVDTSSTYNVITWEKPIATDIDSFRIYREVLSSFNYIGSVSYDSLSEYVDNTYLPLADPNTTNFRYKISVVDTCGNESVLSNHHRTIFLQANVGVGGVVNLNWVPYEGATVNFYRILRDTLGAGAFVAIDSVPGSNTVYTDLTPAFSSLNVRYMLESNWAVTCTPTRATVNTSRSNIKHVGMVTTNIEQEILNANFNVYPNPATDQITVEYPSGFKKYKLQLFDALGQLVIDEEVNSDGIYKGVLTHKMNVSTLTKGIYIVNIQTENGSSFKRLTIQ